MASVAIAVGVSLVSQFVTSLLTPTQEVEGQRLENLDSPKSQFGATISKPYGVVRFNGCNLFWSPNLKETKKKKRSGKGGGRTETTYSYSANFAVLICDGSVDSIRRIWFNNQLVYAKSIDMVQQDKDKADRWETKYAEFYLGSATQGPSPVIQSFEGVNDTPAFRGKTYIVFRDLPLSDYGNRIPKVDVEVVERPQDPLVSDILTDVCGRAGIPPTDLVFTTEFTALDLRIPGAVFPQDGGTTRKFIEDLQRIFFFLVKDSGGKLVFFPQIRASSPILDLKPGDLGAKEKGSPPIALYKEVKEAELELPREVQLEYRNLNNDHNPGLQFAKRSVNSNVDRDNALNIRTSLVLNDGLAATSAARLLQQIWLQRIKYEGMRLLPTFIDLAPGDLVRLPVGGRLIPAQIQKLTVGADLLLEFSAVLYDATINEYSVDWGTDNNYQPNFDMREVIDPTPLPFDCNLISDLDAEDGIYFATTSTGAFDGGAIFSKLFGGTYLEVSPIEDLSTVGTVALALPARSVYVVDRKTTFDVVLTSGELEPITETDFYNFSQMALVGNELIVFKNASLIAPKIYRCSELIRGVRGTEWAIATHTPNETFILVRGGDLVRLTGSPNDLGQLFNFKAVPTGVAVDDVTPEATLQVVGNAYKPYSPCNPVLTRFSSSGDLRIGWNRRTRRYGQWQDNIDAPLEEAYEQYVVEIRNGATVLRTVFVNLPYYDYPSSQQIADFGSTRLSLSFNVYQLSARVGRGYPLSVNNLSISRSVP